MFKSIQFISRQTGYHLIDTDFDVCVPLPYQESGYRYRLYNGALAANMPSGISKALAMIPVYQNRKANVPKNLALYYLSLSPRTDQTKFLAIATLWFGQYCPEIKFNEIAKCICNQIHQYKWIKQIKS
jgi:hypothetical protein